MSLQPPIISMDCKEKERLGNYSSKHNPIEHRVFLHLQRTIEGGIFTNCELVLELAQRTTTTTGLKVVVRINEQYYPTGIKTTPHEGEFQRI